MIALIDFIVESNQAEDNTFNVQKTEAERS